MSEVTPTPNQVLEKTTRTRIISETQIPDFWDYIEHQNLPDADHVLYLYLNRDNRNIPYGVYTSHFPARDGRLVPIYDREAFEQAVQSRFGGGVWRLILKCGRSKKTEAKIYTGDGPTLPPPVDGPQAGQPIAGMNPNNPFTQLPPPPDNSAQIAGQAFDALRNQDRTAADIGFQAMRTGLEAVTKAVELSQKVPNGSQPAGPLQDALMNAVIARLAADPLQQITQLFSVMREINSMSGAAGAGDGNNISRQLENLRSAFGIVRELGGQASPAVSTGAELVRVVAGAVPQFVDGIREWRIAKEAERETVALMQQPARPAPPPSPFRPPAPPQLASPAAPSPLAPGNAAGANPAGYPTTEFIERRILELFRAPISADEAASRVLEFLHTLAGEDPPPERNYVAQLAVLGETGLVNVFNLRPELKPATGNMSRLLEFIRAFLKYYAEDQAEEGDGKSKPN